MRPKRIPVDYKPPACWRPGGAIGNDRPAVQNGDSILAAARYISPHDEMEYWEYIVCDVQCDEHFFRLRSNLSESFSDWDWSDVEYWMPLSEFGLPNVPAEIEKLA